LKDYLKVKTKKGVSFTRVPFFVSRNSAKGRPAYGGAMIAKAMGHSDVATTLRYYLDACPPKL